MHWTDSLAFPYLAWLTSSVPIFGGFALCICLSCLIPQVNSVYSQERSRLLGTSLRALCMGDLHEGLLNSKAAYKISPM